MNGISLQQQLKELISGGKSMGLQMLAGVCRKSELEVIKALPEGMGMLFEGSYFDKVWQMLTEIDTLTFFIESSGNIFEFKTKIEHGREGFGYFNLFGKNCLNGHLRKETVSSIALLKIPFMQLESRQVAFINTDGKVMYSFYLPREGQKIDPKAEELFNAFIAENGAN